jgi:heat shock protein HslJ
MPSPISEPSASDFRLGAMTASSTRLVVATAALALLAAACSAAAPSLADREFLSVNVTDGGQARPLVAGTRIRLNFSGANLGASAGCNSIGGTYRVQDGRLIFEGGVMTEMACDPDRDRQDQWLITFLGSRPTIRLSGNDLTLVSGSVAVQLLDRKVAEPDANLVGPTWTLASIIDGDAVSSVPAGQSATLTFRSDGTVDVFAGCNRGSGAWKLAGAGIEVGGIALTKMACDGPAALVEAAVLRVLNAGGALSAEIRASSLTLRSGGAGLQLQAG